MARSFLGQVYAITAVPATTGCFFAVHPMTIAGTATESGTPALAADPLATEFAYVAGGRPPVAGDVLACHELPPARGPDAYGHPLAPQPMWVAEPLPLNGGGIVIAGCSCTSIPPSLTMTASNPAANNGMFQDCTLVYGPTPSGYAGLPMGPNSYLSTQSFTDQFNNTFRYFFYCQGNQFFLTRVYLVSIFGSPYEDTVRYTWTTGTTGNTCSPFLLGNGRVYAGGDTSDVVTISG